MVRKWTVSPALLAWLSVGLSIHLMSGYGVSRDVVQLLLGAAGLAHCAVGFWTDGRQRITAPNIYLFASALFIFFPGIYLVGNDPISFGQAQVVPALFLCYFSQVLMYHLFWCSMSQSMSVAEPPPANDRVTSWGMWAGFALIVTVVALRQVGIPDSPLVNGAAFSGVALLAAASLRRTRRIGLASYALIGLGFFAYMEFVFSGFGRLELGAMALCVAIATAHRWRGRLVKAVILAATAPGVMYFAASRVAFTAALNPAQSASVSGLESVVSPLVRFAQLIELERAGELQHTYLNSVYATVVFWVPRRLWPGKPEGFGAELAHFFRPELDGRGHSELALFHGEWLFAAGLIGLALMVPVVGLLVRWMDVILQKASDLAIRERADLLKVVAIIIASASIVDLVWGGTFTYMARVGSRLLILLALYVALGRNHVDSASKKRSLPRRRVPTSQGGSSTSA
jgi:hypothetical protein